MKIFIDSADVDEISEMYKAGIVDGITTNPSLIKKASEKHKQDMKDYILNILAIAGKDPVSLEVWGKKKEDITNRARKLVDMFGKYGNIAVKIPINTSYEEESDYEALRAVKELSSEGINTNVTLIMSPEQALLAAKAGATYISPFLGRIDDHIKDMHPNSEHSEEEYIPNDGIRYDGKLIHDKGIIHGVHLVEEIIKIYKNYDFNTRIIAASIRNEIQLRNVAKMGVDIATVPYKILSKMLAHKKTSEGVKRFDEDLVDDYKAIFD